MSALASKLFHYLGFPAVWLIKALGLPDSLYYGQYFLANVLVIGILLVAYWAFLLWRRGRQIFYLFLYLFLVGLSVVGFQATVTIDRAWVYALLLVMTSLIFLSYSQISSRFPPIQKRSFRRFYLFGLLISLAMPISYSLLEQRNQNKHLGEAQISLNQEIATINDRLTSQATLADTLAQAPDLFNPNHLDAVAYYSYLQNLQQQNNLGFLIVTDSLANLIAQSNRPDLRNQNLFEQYPWSIVLFEGAKLDGIAQDTSLQPILVSGRKVDSGFLLIGQYLNQDYLKDVVKLNNYAMVDKSGLVYFQSAKGNIAKVYTVSNLNATLRTTLSQAEPTEQISTTVQYDKAPYLIAARRFSSLEYGRSFYLLTLREAQTSRWFKMLDITLVLGGSLLVILFLSLSKRVFFKLWQRGAEKKPEVTEVQEVAEVKTEDVQKPA